MTESRILVPWHRYSDERVKLAALLSDIVYVEGPALYDDRPSPELLAGVRETDWLQIYRPWNLDHLDDYIEQVRSLFSELALNDEAGIGMRAPYEDAEALAYDLEVGRELGAVVHYGYDNVGSTWDEMAWQAVLYAAGQQKKILASGSRALAARLPDASFATWAQVTGARREVTADLRRVVAETETATIAQPHDDIDEALKDAFFRAQDDLEPYLDDAARHFGLNKTVDVGLELATIIIPPALALKEMLDASREYKERAAWNRSIARAARRLRQ